MAIHKTGVGWILKARRFCANRASEEKNGREGRLSGRPFSFQANIGGWIN
jgi:hypothetical protein